MLILSNGHLPESQQWSSSLSPRLMLEMSIAKDSPSTAQMCEISGYL